MTVHTSVSEIAAAFDEVFDQAVVFHGFADYMRDYDVVVYATAAPSTGIPPEHLLYRFQHCVQAVVTTTVRDDVWPASLDDRLIDYETGVDLDGYVWGVKWHLLYPGMKLIDESEEAHGWSQRLGIPMLEAAIETNAHLIRLVFSGLEVATLRAGWSPFAVGADGPEGKVPLEADNS